MSKSSNLAEIRWSGEKLSIEDEHELIKRYQKNKDEDAANILIENHIALVKNIVSSYKPPASYFDDVLAEGTLGLMKAIEKFDLSRNVRLSTYATFYIRLMVGRFIDTQTKIIKVPLNKTLKIRKELRNTEFNDLEDNLKDIAQNNELLSLDYQIDTGGSQDKTVYDMIPDSAPTPADVASANELNELLLEIFSTLPPKEEYIVKNYFGIGCPQRNLNELSETMGISHQRGSQILKSAMTKLKEEPRRSLLASLAKDFNVISFFDSPSPASNTLTNTGKVRKVRKDKGVPRKLNETKVSAEKKKDNKQSKKVSASVNSKSKKKETKSKTVITKKKTKSKTVTKTTPKKVKTTTKIKSVKTTSKTKKVVSKTKNNTQKTKVKSTSKRK